MNRRGFLNLLGKASAGAYIAYSFPSIIVPNNLILPEAIPIDFISELNIITKKEIYPNLINDIFFMDSPFLARIRNKYGMSVNEMQNRIYN